jgi:hypothetical protein
VLLACFTRLAVICFWDESFAADPTQDPDAYRQIAEHWRAEGLYSRDGLQPTAYRPPGFVLCLWPMVADQQVSVWGLAAWHLVVGVLTTALTMGWARGMMGSRPGPTWVGPWIAGLVVAVDPLLVGQSALVMSEATFTLWMTAALFWTSSASSLTGRLLAGFAWGMAGLTRPIAWPVGAGVLLWMLIQRRRFLLIAAVALGVAIPWVVRNQFVWNQPILTTTHGGYTLWLGQNPNYYETVVQPGKVIWPAEDFARWSAENERELAGKSEPEQDRLLAQKALAWMRSHPVEARETSLHHLARLWALAPARGSWTVRAGVTAFYSLLFLVAIVGWLRAPRSTLWLLIVAPVVFSLVHAFYWSDLRMRAPLTPILGVAAALAWADRRSANLEACPDGENKGLGSA